MHWLADRYVWLAWSGAWLVAWALLYGAFPRLRRPMWLVSLCTSPFGLTEPLFVGEYWRPPGLFNLARRTHFDIESVIYCFAIGGIAAVLYNAIAARPLSIPTKTWRQGRHQQWYILALLLAGIVYVPMLTLTNLPLWSGVIAMAIGAAARLVLFPSLRVKTCAGGVVFLILYLISLLFLQWISPGYITRVWLAAIPGGWIAGVPRAELCFALSFGLFWSGIFEQFVWTFSPPHTSATHAGSLSAEPILARQMKRENVKT